MPEVGRIEAHNGTIRIGVDGAAVTIGGPRPIVLTREQRDHFMRLWMIADGQAEDNETAGVRGG